MDSYYEENLKSNYLGFRYDDEIFKINWPFKPKILSKKDKNYPKFNLKYMRILITGGTGFIGKHLLSKLENTKYKILVCSRKLYKNKSNIKYTKQDIGRKLNHTIKNFKPILIHLAWRNS